MVSRVHKHLVHVNTFKVYLDLSLTDSKKAFQVFKTYVFYSVAEANDGPVLLIREGWEGCKRLRQG